MCVCVCVCLCVSVCFLAEACHTTLRCGLDFWRVIVFRTSDNQAWVCRTHPTARVGCRLEGLTDNSAAFARRDFRIARSEQVWLPQWISGTSHTLFQQWVRPLVSRKIHANGKSRNMIISTKMRKIGCLPVPVTPFYLQFKGSTL